MASRLLKRPHNTCFQRHLRGLVREGWKEESKVGCAISLLESSWRSDCKVCTLRTVSLHCILYTLKDGLSTQSNCFKNGKCSGLSPLVPPSSQPTPGVLQQRRHPERHVAPGRNGGQWRDARWRHLQLPRAVLCAGQEPAVRPLLTDSCFSRKLHASVLLAKISASACVLSAGMCKRCAVFKSRRALFPSFLTKEKMQNVFCEAYCRHAARCFIPLSVYFKTVFLESRFVIQVHQKSEHNFDNLDWPTVAKAVSVSATVADPQSLRWQESVGGL